jgi:hypothetical protein
MAIPVDVLEAEALSLSEADRSRLIDRLIASLEKDPEWESAWADEADRREARVGGGESAWVRGEDAVARIRTGLA